MCTKHGLFTSVHVSIAASDGVFVACVQVNQLLELESVQTVTTQKYKAIDKWSQHLHTLHQSILNKMT